MDNKFLEGSHIVFGTYPQQMSGIDATPIEWIILQQTNDRALLVSRYGIDVKPYHSTYSEVGWHDCYLRRWLNEEFWDSAFSKEQKQTVILTKTSGSLDTCTLYTNTADGASTFDHVFLLSCAEVGKFFGADFGKLNIHCRISPTPYAIAQGAHLNTFFTTQDAMPSGWWWLRSSEACQQAKIVFTDGSLYHNHVFSNDGLVRPAIFIAL